MNQQEQVKAVNVVQEFLKANVQRRIRLIDVAQTVGYSPGHISRMFKAYTGRSIFDYMRVLRLSEAALRLRDHETRVVDVAFDFVFETHEGFTRAFSKEFGIAPKRYSQETPPIRLFMPYPVRESYRYEKGLEEMEKKTEIETVFVQVIDRPERKVILKRGVKAEDYFAYCKEVSCDVWGILCSVKDALNEPMGMWLPAGMIKAGTSRYVQGVEVCADFNGVVPEGFDLITLPACKMMVFQGTPYDDTVFKNAISSMWKLMKGYDPTIYGFDWADADGPRFQFEPQGYRGYIEGRPVRLIK